MTRRVIAPALWFGLIVFDVVIFARQLGRARTIRRNAKAAAIHYHRT